MRYYSPVDKLLLNFDNGLRTVFGQPMLTERSNPAADLPEAEMATAERELAGRLMRVNHAGEVAAQGLYQGQALTARLTDVRAQMESAALEENDHLAWCAQRANELGSRVSYLNPLWYTGSQMIGALAGAVGDKWSLGFVMETERQVVCHLDKHLTRLPGQDLRSRAILEQMKIDESNHAKLAQRAGGVELPGLIKKLMQQMARMMTRTAYWV